MRRLATTASKHHLHQRCLIPGDGFYDWTADRTPIRFALPDNGASPHRCSKQQTAG